MLLCLINTQLHYILHKYLCHSERIPFMEMFTSMYSPMLSEGLFFFFSELTLPHFFRGLWYVSMLWVLQHSAFNITIFIQLLETWWIMGKGKCSLHDAKALWVHIHGAISCSVSCPQNDIVFILADEPLLSY